VIRARVVTWPAPGGDADGIYGVRVTGLSAESAQEMVRVAHALGLWVRWHEGDPILQGPGSLFAGFIGAGVILHHDTEHRVEGLTTAASIWLAAALGVACGGGHWISGGP